MDFVGRKTRVQVGTESAHWKVRCFCFDSTGVLLEQQARPAESLTPLTLGELLRKVGSGRSLGSHGTVCTEDKLKEELT